MFKVSKSVCILTTQAIMKLLRSKEAAAAVDIKSWPMLLDTGDFMYTHANTPRSLVYVLMLPLTSIFFSIERIWSLICATTQKSFLLFLFVFQMTSPERRVPRCTSLRPQRCWPTWTSVCPQLESLRGSKYVEGDSLFNRYIWAFSWALNRVQPLCREPFFIPGSTTHIDLTILPFALRR